MRLVERNICKAARGGPMTIGLAPRPRTTKSAVRWFIRRHDERVGDTRRWPWRRAYRYTGDVWRLHHLARDPITTVAPPKTFSATDALRSLVAEGKYGCERAAAGAHEINPLPNGCVCARNASDSHNA